MEMYFCARVWFFIHLEQFEAVGQVPWLDG